jgi:hypothetical protein
MMARGKMVEITLTKEEIERILLYYSLNDNVESVMIRETRESGIGPSHRVIFRNRNPDLSLEADITDVSAW